MRSPLSTSRLRTAVLLLGTAAALVALPACGAADDVARGVAPGADEAARPPAVRPNPETAEDVAKELLTSGLDVMDLCPSSGNGELTAADVLPTLQREAPDIATPGWAAALARQINASSAGSTSCQQ